MNTTRAQIATALSTVSGVKGYAKRPTAVKAGDAWPILAAVTRGPGDSWGQTWRVLVLLPGSERDAVDAVDLLLPSLLGAVDGVVWVESAEPVVVATDAGDLPALQLSATSE
jgi:hypothetical protein